MLIVPRTGIRRIDEAHSIVVIIGVLTEYRLRCSYGSTIYITSNL